MRRDAIDDDGGRKFQVRSRESARVGAREWLIHANGGAQSVRPCGRCELRLEQWHLSCLGRICLSSLNRETLWRVAAKYYVDESGIYGNYWRQAEQASKNREGAISLLLTSLTSLSVAPRMTVLCTSHRFFTMGT